MRVAGAGKALEMDQEMLEMIKGALPSGNSQDDCLKDRLRRIPSAERGNTGESGWLGGGLLTRALSLQG